MNRIEKNSSSLLELVERELWADWIEEVYLERKNHYFPFEVGKLDTILSTLNKALASLTIDDKDLKVRKETKRALQTICAKRNLSLKELIDFFRLLYVCFDNNLNTIFKEVLQHFISAIINLENHSNKVNEVKHFFSYLADLLLQWRIDIKELRNKDHQKSPLLNQFKNIINAKESVLNYNYRNADGDNPYWYYSLVFNLIISDKGKPSYIARTLKALKVLHIDKKEYNRREALAYKALNYILNTQTYFEQLFKEDINDFFDSKGNLYKFETTFKQYLNADFFVELNENKSFEVPKKEWRSEHPEILIPALTAIHSDSISFEELMTLSENNKEEYKDIYCEFLPKEDKEALAVAC